MGNLILGNAHVICHVGEDRGADEVSLVAEFASTGHQASSFLLSSFDEFHNCIYLISIDLKTL